MRTRAERRVAARYRWDRLKVSFWFAPALMALGAVLLAWVMYWVDSLVPNACLLYTSSTGAQPLRNPITSSDSVVGSTCSAQSPRWEY